MPPPPAIRRTRPAAANSPTLRVLRTEASDGRFRSSPSADGPFSLLPSQSKRAIWAASPSYPRWRTDSQWIAAARLEIGNCLPRQSVQPARRHILLDLAVPGIGQILLEPASECTQLGT